MRVMIITHDTERRTRLTEFLSDRGYEVSVPPHRQDMWGMVKQTPPHVIVLDLYVADPSGADILCELRADGYNGKVVALAGLSSRTTLSKCWQAGIDHVVGGLQATGGAFDPGQVDVAIQASFQKEIAQRAYDLWVQLGRPKGQDHQHWSQAEREFFAQLGHPVREPSLRQEACAPHHNPAR
ncbi:MAG: DUF2934 domain-containing protein [Nitrospirota bacterium]|nr:DUF2934 domain-containing protein [Nitrospirota bacterium]